MAKIKTADELLAKFKREHLNVPEPGPVNGPSGAAELKDARGRGESFICVKPVKYNGKQYEIGDPFVPADGKYDDKLMEQGYFTTAAKWTGSREYSAHKKFYREAIVPLEVQLGQARAAEGKSRVYLVAVQAELSNAESTLRDRAEQVKLAEQRLAEALMGAEIEQ